MSGDSSQNKKRRGCLDVLLFSAGLVLASMSVAMTAGPKHVDWEAEGTRAATYPDISVVDTTFVPESAYIKMKKK